MKLFQSLCFSFILLATLPFVAFAAPVIDSDVCVYGGTSGGVVAAVAAARLGKNVALVVFNNHVGGMTSGGLGVTDKGNATSIGGIAAEFYARVGKHYGSASPVYYFEPHIAEQTFNEMLLQAAVPVHTNQQISSVTLVNQRITQITMQDGTIYRAKMFIDATYEGDLMAMAGVTFTVGREGTNVYNESLAGVRTPGYSYAYDPYVIAGNSSSGLLPFVQAGSPGVVGQGDNNLQTYNFRLCLTQNPTNQIPIAPPAGYAESQYQLFARYLAARVAADGSVALNQLIDVQTIIPNGKTDINANGELSTDFVGYNATYPTNTYAGRQIIRQQHEDYIRGLLYFLATSSLVPLNVRTNMQSWALAKDEFQDSGGWPHQLYVREARRMISDYVMTQWHTDLRSVAPDPVALASYGIDSHPDRRLAVAGKTQEEGGLGGTVTFPYGVSYRSLIPRAGECQNLFSTFALSASHVAYASIRMEPVFMMLSQSAGTAAAFAIDDNVPVQQLNYQKLAAQLRADGQMLVWAGASSYTTNGIILDQGDVGDVTSSSGWTTGANSGGWNGDYWHDGATGKGAKWVYYHPVLPTNGTYDVYLWWVESSNRATNTPVDIIHAAGTNRVLVNQRLASGGWFKILTTNFNAGTGAGVIIRNDNTAAGTYVIADGVRWMPVGNALPPPPPPPPPTVEIVASDAVAGEFGPDPGRFTLVRNNDTNLLPVTVNYSVSGTAINGTSYAALPGVITIPAAAPATNIFISPIPDNLVEGDRTVTLTLLASTNYFLDALSNATLVLLDRPVDDWRLANFTTPQLNDPQISGDLADPDHDGLSNLMEYALGLPPLAANVNPFNPRITGGYLQLTYPRLKSATDVALTAEYSSDLVTWQSGPAWFAQSDLVDQGATQLITVTTTTPVGPSTRGFVRLRVTRL